MIGPFFDRHRGDDPLIDDPGIGGRGSNGGRGVSTGDIGSGDGVRPFGGGRGENQIMKTLFELPIIFKYAAKIFIKQLFIVEKQVLEPLTGPSAAVEEEVGIQTAQQVTVQPVLE